MVKLEATIIGLDQTVLCIMRMRKGYVFKVNNTRYIIPRGIIPQIVSTLLAIPEKSEGTTENIKLTSSGYEKISVTKVHDESNDIPTDYVEITIKIAEGETTAKLLPDECKSMAALLTDYIIPATVA